LSTSDGKAPRQQPQLRRDRYLVQNSVDSIANAKIVLEWFDVDVGRTFQNCFANNLVHEFYDRCIWIVGI